MKTWKDVNYKFLLNERKQNRIIGLTFPACNKNLGLEPSILTVLPQDKTCEYSLENIDFNDDDVHLYACSVYIAGMEEFKQWAMKHDKNKIVVGGYHPTMFPDDFVNYANKIVVGCCDSGGFWLTLAQNGQIVNGISIYDVIPRYDLYDINFNQQIIPDKKVSDVCTSINTSMGCPMRCDFCCSPIMCPKLVSKPFKLIKKEVEYIDNGSYSINIPKYIFIRDENFPMQKDWKERLKLINKIGAKIYLFSSANFITQEVARYMKDNGVYMICLGLENINTEYKKNANIDNAVKYLKEVGIYTYLSFIVNPLEIIGKEEGESFYGRLMERLFELKPEMITGNFLMPFKGTALWDKYYAFVDESDYKDYDSKSAFLIKNKVVRKKMEFFMFYYQWIYYNSEIYNKEVRKFACGDTLHERFLELYCKFKPQYERMWNVRA